MSARDDVLREWDSVEDIVCSEYCFEAPDRGTENHRESHRAEVRALLDAYAAEVRAETWWQAVCIAIEHGDAQEDTSEAQRVAYAIAHCLSPNTGV